MKGKARDTWPTLAMIYKSLTRPAVTIGSSGGLFALKNYNKIIYYIIGKDIRSKGGGTINEGGCRKNS